MSSFETRFGVFRFELYELNDSGDGMQTILTFEAGTGVAAEKIGMVQMANTLLRGAPFALDGDPIIVAHSIPAGLRFAGSHIDQRSTNRNPVYSLFSGPGSPDSLDSGEPVADLGKLGMRFFEGSFLHEEKAELRDRPLVTENGDCEQRFETACLALSGPDRGLWYGSVVWGWNRVGGVAERIAPDRAAARGTSATFARVVEIWNGSHAESGEATIQLPAPVVE